MTKNGLTLIEIVVIIVLIAFWGTSILIITQTNLISSSNGGCGSHALKCLNNLENFYRALFIYYTDNKVFPTDLTGENVWLELGKRTSNILRVEKPTETGDCKWNPIYQCPCSENHYVSGDYAGPKAGWDEIFNKYNEPSMKRMFLGADKCPKKRWRCNDTNI